MVMNGPATGYLLRKDDGRLLCTFASDTAAGQAKRDGVSADGGLRTAPPSPGSR
jgi:hypothetical protein